MKRLRPERRRQIIRDHLAFLANDWVARYGDWNRDKLLTELAQTVRQQGHKVGR